MGSVLNEYYMSKSATLPELKLLYINKIRHHDKHGAYIPMNVLQDIRTLPDWHEINDAVFAVINAENAYLMTGWNFDDIDGDDIIIRKVG